MLKASYLGLFIALLFCRSNAYAESTANKCTDGKQITYANMPCEKLGLKSIGPVKDAVIVVPATKIPKKNPPADPEKKHFEKNDAQAAGVSEGDAPEPPAIIKPVNPMVEKMLQW